MNAFYYVSKVGDDEFGAQDFKNLVDKLKYVPQV